MEPAAELVVDSALGHFGQGLAHHVPEFQVAGRLMHPEKKRKHETIGKLGRVSQAAVDPVVMLGQRARAGLRHVGS